jgi:hypothetical protein
MEKPADPAHHLPAELKRRLADLEQAQSDRDEALARLSAAQMEIKALRKCLDNRICEQAKPNRPSSPDESVF